FIDRSNLAVYAVSQGRYEEAIGTARDALALQPGNVEPLSVMCEVLADDKRPGHKAACEFWIAINSGDKTAAQAVIDPIVATYPDNGVSPGDISTAYRFVHED